MKENLLESIQLCLDDETAKCGQCERKHDKAILTCRSVLEECKEVLEFVSKLGKLQTVEGDYKEQIDFACKTLVENPETLKPILIQYDNLVKQSMNYENMELPYWCYGWNGNKIDSEV